MFSHSCVNDSYACPSITMTDSICNVSDVCVLILNMCNTYSSQSLCMMSSCVTLPKAFSNASMASLTPPYTDCQKLHLHTDTELHKCAHAQTHRQMHRRTDRCTDRHAASTHTHTHLGLQNLKTLVARRAGTLQILVAQN